MLVFWLFSFVFFFKQKTAYEMRISDWSSDVGSSDLLAGEVIQKFSEVDRSSESTDESILAKVHFGASSAENEITDLADYYLATDEFRRALQGEARLVVGRKGSGKSAVFFRVRDKDRKSTRLNSSH